ncbi:MAG: polyhydroxyalkanoic acid system family protein [Polyangiaceae bacterium]|jgi:putative polyhydroxyalkanoate system protein
MATIDIRKTHTLTIDDAKKRAEQIATSMDQKLDLEWHWEQDRIVFAATRGMARGTRGSVDVSASDVRVQIDLPLLLRMMKGTVEAKVTEQLTQIL